MKSLARGFCLLLTIFSALAEPTPQPVLTQSITLAWTLPNDPRVVSTRIYYGSRSRNYQGYASLPAPGNELRIDNLTPGELYYFTAATEDAAGNESTYSNEVRWFIAGAKLPLPDKPLALPPPVNLIQKEL